MDNIKSGQEHGDDNSGTKSSSHPDFSFSLPVSKYLHEGGIKSNSIRIESFYLPYGLLIELALIEIGYELDIVRPPIKEEYAPL
jgi:hypothetical protein